MELGEKADLTKGLNNKTTVAREASEYYLSGFRSISSKLEGVNAKEDTKQLKGKKNSRVNKERKRELKLNMSLPSFLSFSITIRITSIGDIGIKFLRHIGTSLSYEEEEAAVSENTRFAVERADSGNGLVHLRHVFTNKYLARGVTEPSFIKVEADEKEEDQSVQGCTLFRPQFKNENTITLVHVQSGLSVYVKHTVTTPFPSYLVLANEPGAVALETQFFDLQSILILPKRIVIKGDNDKYLGHYRLPLNITTPEVFFDYEDIADPKAQFEVVQHKRGHTTIRSIHHKNWFLLIGPNGGSVQALTENNENPMNWFTALDGPNGSVCLRGVDGSVANKFCERLYSTGFLHCTAPSMLSGAQFVIEEPLVSRTVYVDFRLDSSRIFNARPLLAASATTKNESDFEHTSDLDVSYKKSTSRTWNNTFRVMAGVTTTFVTKVPFIAEGKIETTVETEYQHEWGGSVSTEESVTKKESVKIQPWHVASVTVLATEGQCNIPFTYRQLDILLDGQKKETVLHDGVYDNVNSYDFHTIISQVPLDRSDDSEKAQESPDPMARDEYEILVEIYKEKVAEARAGKFDLSTPTIIYGKPKKKN